MSRRKSPRRPAGSRAPATRFEGIEPLEQRLALAVNAWTGLGDGLHLMDPANWDHNHVPRTNEVALIETATPLLMDAGSMAGSS